MKFYRLYFLFIAFFFFNFSIAAYAKESVGSLRNVTGLATISRLDDAGKRRIIRAKNGLHVYQGDMVKTTQGILGIIFNDNTRISLARNSVMVVNKYVYKPGKKKYGMITRVMKGQVAVFSGQISNLQANAMVFKTPNATIGSRGSNFLLEVGE